MAAYAQKVTPLTVSLKSSLQWHKHHLQKKNKSHKALHKKSNSENASQH